MRPGSSFCSLSHVQSFQNQSLTPRFSKNAYSQGLGLFLSFSGKQPSSPHFWALQLAFRVRPECSPLGRGNKHGPWNVGTQAGPQDTLTVLNVSDILSQGVDSAQSQVLLSGGLL